MRWLKFYWFGNIVRGWVDSLQLAFDIAFLLLILITGRRGDLGHVGRIGDRVLQPREMQIKSFFKLRISRDGHNKKLMLK